jgi:cytochrome c oxidase subunit 2
MKNNGVAQKLRLSQVRNKWVGFLLPLLLGGCANAPSMLDPQGPAAAKIANLGWMMFWLAAFVFGAVITMLLYALFRPRRNQNNNDLNPRRDKIIIVGGGVVTILILVVVYLLTLRSLIALAASEASDDVMIEVVGHQWWWEVRYPNQSVTTANEVHIPVGQSIKLQVTSADVIHSLWVPELHGKIDLIPNRTNTISFQADSPGIYYGECAEFCGIQHAKMTFIVVAKPEEEFTSWLELQGQPAAPPTDPLAQEGLRVFLAAECSQCHMIKGTEAAGTLGPDLTHLASRSTLAAGALPNTRGHMGGWIISPQNIKPGALMPSTPLSGTELQALLAYLESLE